MTTFDITCESEQLLYCEFYPAQGVADLRAARALSFSRRFVGVQDEALRISTN
jgi:hypothetical protein